MRAIIGYVLLGLIFPTALYAYFHPPTSAYGISIVALAVGGGIMLRRGRDDRRRRIAAVPDPLPAAAPPAKQTPIPPAPPLPTFEDPGTPNDPEVRTEEAWKEGDVIFPPAPDKSAMRAVLKLVHTDGKRADVRDFRRKAAK
jgi:hypothetical protein